MLYSLLCIVELTLRHNVCLILLALAFEMENVCHTCINVRENRRAI